MSCRGPRMTAVYVKAEKTAQQRERREQKAQKQSFWKIKVTLSVGCIIFCSAEGPNILGSLLIKALTCDKQDSLYHAPLMIIKYKIRVKLKREQ